MKINLNIGSLVLSGVDIPRSHYPCLQQAVEGELARLLETSPPSQWQAATLGRVSAPEIQLSGGSSVQVMGKQIAQAVHKELGAGS